MKDIANWVREAVWGRKTYIVSGLLILTTLVLVALGRLTAETASAVLLIFLGLFAATFRAALAAHPHEVLGVFQDAAVLGKALAGKNSKAAGAAGIALMTDAAGLADEIRKETPAR